MANFTLMAVISLTILHSIAALDGAPHVRDWVAAFAATQIAAILTAIVIATVITVSGGAPQLEKLPEMIRFGSLVAYANTSLALLAVSILWLDATLLWLLALPLVIIFLAYRAYVSGAREARAAGAALPVVADPAALARARRGPGGAARPRPHHVPGRAGRDRALSAPLRG